MLQTNAKKTTTVGESKSKATNYQVLNISSVNAQNEIVLNDELLLSLIQLYPFLYNPHVKPNKDPDYDNYAWEQITKTLNQSYEQYERNISYTTNELRNRWNVLQPIVRSLSKLSNLKSLPDTLRQTIIKMSVPMDEPVNAMYENKPLTAAQEVIQQNMEMVKKLPLQHRRRLEAEIMEIILDAELDKRGTIKLGPVEQQTIEKECTEFLNAIGLATVIPERELEIIPDVIPTIVIPQTEVNSTAFEETNNQPTFIVNNGLSEVFQINILNEDQKPVIENECDLLKPMPSKRWVPLSNWRDYVRKCRVRIKRTSLEDDIPLSRIKREKI